MKSYRKAVLVIFALFVGILLIVASPRLLSFHASAHSGHVLSAYATITPTIDGNISPAEWDDAASVSFMIGAPGESHESTLYVKNDGTNLYLAWLIRDEDFDTGDLGRFHFDNDHDGIREIGDDAINCLGVSFCRDDFLLSDVTFDEGADLPHGGSDDVVSAATHTNPTADQIGDYVFEVSHPLNTNDDSHDFSLLLGDAVGLALESYDAGKGAGRWPQPGFPLFNFADIVIASPPALPIDIDIKPGSDPNSINCNSPKLNIAVAILTTQDFDATTVDHNTVTFEGASEVHVDKKSGQPKRHEEDVDGDGDIDLVFHFGSGDTWLTCSSTEGMLVGETFDGQAIAGSDEIRMVDH